MEKWRQVIDKQGKIINGYVVSNLGRIMNKQGKIMSTYTKKGTSYQRLCLRDNGRQRKFYLHNLVALAFPDICGKYEEGLEIDHLNGNAADNRAKNLHWCTRSENLHNPNTYYRCVEVALEHLKLTRAAK